MRAIYFLLITLVIGCASSPTPPAPEAPQAPSEYTLHFNTLTEDQKAPLRKNFESFYEFMRGPVLLARIDKIQIQNPALQNLRGPAETPNWFVPFFETLMTAELMAKANSFRSYRNADCLTAFLRPLANLPLPPEAPLLTLVEFMKAGPRIPDDATYSGQIKLYCGRRAINAFQGQSPESLRKIGLSLRHQPVVQKWILNQASQEAAAVLNAHHNVLD